MQNKHLEFSIFYSTKFSQKFLEKNYQTNSIDNKNLSLNENKQYKSKSFENYPAFIAYIDHGLIYLKKASSSPLQIKPLLIFYGLVHLVKACVLVIDPDYPRTTAVLAHGVSTKKKKKPNYEFLQDEIKIQQNGLFSHASKILYQNDTNLFKKYNMKELLIQVNGMSHLFHTLFTDPIEIKAEEQLPEILTHYLIFYNLSMIARYETVWWFNLLKTFPNYDYIFITQYIDYSLEKIPNLIYQWLQSKM